jgi:hypothetical protein
MEIMINGSRPEFLMEKAFSFRNLKVVKAWAERPIHQVNKPYLSFVLKGGDKVFTAISPVDTSGKSFVPINLLERIAVIYADQDIKLDSLQIRPYNFAVHPAQRIHVKLSVA